jgi:DNA excision repair protein ERCC-4
MMSLDHYLQGRGSDEPAPVDIVVDSREAHQMPGVAEELSRMGVRVDVRPLAAGDYLLYAPPGGKPLLVERKTPTDFLESVKGRLWDQLEVLKSAEADGFSVAVALVGHLPVVRRLTKWNESSVARLIDEVALSWRIPIIPCPDRRWFTTWLAAKSKSLGKGGVKRMVAMRHARRGMSLNDKILYVLEGAVGTQTARELLRKFGTINAIANAPVDALRLPGLVGDKRAHEIWSIFHTPWKEGVETPR